LALKSAVKFRRFVISVFLRHSVEYTLTPCPIFRDHLIESNFGSLDWWNRKDEDIWNKGKSHPHFVLPDWLAAAAIANQFYDDFVATFENERIGSETADALKDLYNIFKTFDFWSMDGNVLPHIKAAEKLWSVPDDAREFILERAESSE
jgi:hypothetical protein